MTPPPSDHFNGKTFFQPNGNSAGRIGDLLRWRLGHRPARWPRHVPLAPQPPPPVPGANEIVATWIGHATWLLQTTRGNFLTDPQFSACAGPLGRFGPRRTHEPGIAFEHLPRIDAVLLSHDHYDHCDEPSLRRLATGHDPLFVAPLRHHELLAGIGAQRIVELDWWQSHGISPEVTITLTPTQHWSNRLGTPRNHRLWGGFFLTFGLGTAAGAKRLWFLGDSGYHANFFPEISRRCGAPDLALIPIGAYEPRWFMAPMHLNPSEAVRVHREIGARRSLAMHWGTFQLTDEGRDEPVEALAAARMEAGVAGEAFSVVVPGASVVT